ncbi:EAL domain-containing protein [Peribacillus kribbensis]|uniref:EAL domain-containing protein n=1 Tax=Peribacillus kribbensis TaxID=356658 RepID=UPI00041F2400|nr:EAL domain-containing protein [Peribacillus kribbensis]
MGCEVCLPRARGYTVYFSENESTELLESYFQEFPDSAYKWVNERIIWLEEVAFFDLMDYAAVHMDVNHLFAVESPKSDPIKKLNEMRPVRTFRAEREASWIDDLIDKNSLKTFYQPIVSYSDGKTSIIGHELLSRGVDEEGKIIPPYKMFEAARIRNRTFSLDRACRMQCVRNAGAVKDKLIFINFIPTAIYVPEHCLSTTFKLIQELGIKPEQVVFEVVETDEVEDLEHLKKILNYYRSQGFKYALDDVGTGYNNLEKLSRMQPDIVKLAIEYTNGVSKDPSKQEAARKVLEMSHNMHALALAEGVETEEDYQFLIELGYDLFQGYYFSKPQETPAEDLDITEGAYIKG